MCICNTLVSVIQELLSNLYIVREQVIYIRFQYLNLQSLDMPKKGFYLVVHVKKNDKQIP